MSIREFHYQEGTSSKFWRIVRDGCTCTVCFGRIGTAGQTQTKAYADEDAAQAAYTKQITEKLKKGYSEVTPSANDSAIATVVAPAPAPKTAIIATPMAVAATPAATLATESAARSEPTSNVTPPPVMFDLTSRLDLDPTDWFWAHWRGTSPLVRPSAAPFDKADALRRLARVSNSAYQWGWNWEKQIPAVVSPQEATFWLQAMQPAPDQANRTSAEIARALHDYDFNRAVSSTQAFALLDSAPQSMRAVTMVLLAALCSPAEILEYLLEHQSDPLRYNSMPSKVGPELLAGFRRYVLPYLSAAERRQLSQFLRPSLDIAQWPGDRYRVGPTVFYLAAMLGGHNDVLAAVVESWADDRYTGSAWSDYYQRPQEIVLGLNDRRLVEAQMRRLQLRLHKAEYIRAWLAHTEYTALDVVRDTILTEDSRENAVTLTQTLSLAVATEVAPQMFALLHRSKAPQIARSWLEAHPTHTIVGLLPLADGRGSPAEEATDLLRRFARRGYEGLIVEALARMPEDLAVRLRGQILDISQPHQPPFDDLTTPEWLSAALGAQPYLKSAKRSDWPHASDLPPVVVGAHILNMQQVDGLLRALQRSKLDTPHPLVVALKRHAEQASLDAVAWSLFEMWLAEGAPSKENWAFFALGLLGGDATALKLAPLIRTWPGESQHQRAVNGLECLRAIGTDTALMQINRIAQKVKFKGLQQRAAECMDRIAKDRGLSRVELEDRIVPDCDLDARGERIFDFGPRQFRFVLGPQMKPMVRDPQGTLKPNLPAPNTKDDADKAAQALADWKLLKRQVSEVASVQAVRLEQAMVTGRRWTRDEFETLLVRHPLMTHLARTLIWGTYDANGTLTATFRVTEDQTYADSADDTCDLAANASIGIIHPLHLPDDERGAWGEILSDYELVQPFAQLGRPIHHLTEAELAKTDITRFNDHVLSAASLVFGLDKFGWIRDAPGDGGGFHGHSKPFYQANVTAVVQYQEGVGVGQIVDSPDQQIEYVAFVPGIQEMHWWPRHKDRVLLREVDPLVISEVLNDMLMLVAKAK